MKTGTKYHEECERLYERLEACQKTAAMADALETYEPVFGEVPTVLLLPHLKQLRRDLWRLLVAAFIVAETLDKDIEHEEKGY